MGRPRRYAARAPAALPAPPTLTNAQARTIQKLIRERWPDQDAREAAYGRLKDRFQVTRYRDIARSDFDTAVDFITSEQPARTVTLTLPIGKPANIIDTRFAEQRISAALFHAKKSAGLHEALRDDLKAVEMATSRALRTLSRIQSHGEHARLCAGRLLEKETEYAK